MKTEGRQWLCMSALILMAVVLIILSAPVFYLNDDVTMRSILSGAYTGSPDGHAVYMQYPLTGILAVLYRLIGFVPWMEVLFVGSVFCCMFLFARSFESKVQGTLIALAVYIPFVLYMHYTLVAALLAATACYLLVKGDKGIRSGILLLLAFLIRKQVGLLSLPFILCAFIFRVIHIPAQERKRECIDKAKWFAVLAISMLLCSVIHGICYSSEDWKAYSSYNDARTLLYDYTDFLSTESYKENCEAYGMTSTEYDVLYHYNNMLEPSIDAIRMQEIADKVLAGMDGKVVNVSTIKDSIYRYYLQVRYNDTPYNYIWFGMVCLLAIVCICCKGWLQLGVLGALEIGRSLVWTYLIWQGRFPERVSVSLYLIEIMLLLGMLQTMASKEKEPNTKKVLVGWGLAVLLIFACAFEWQDIFRELEHRHKVQKDWDTLKEYCAESPETIYMMDVFSVVPYAENQYTKDSENMKIMGGWLSASPLSEQVFAEMEAKDAAEALLNDKVRLLVNEEKELQWLESYLEGRFGDCELVSCDRIKLQEGGAFSVFKVRRSAP